MENNSNDKKGKKLRCQAHSNYDVSGNILPNIHNYFASVSSNDCHYINCFMCFLYALKIGTRVSLWSLLLLLDICFIGGIGTIDVG